MSTRPQNPAATLENPPVGGQLRALAGVFKLRIGLSITLAAVAGLAAMPGPSISGTQVALLAALVLVSSAAAGGFNQYLERDLDLHMDRTRRRPFVTGQFRVGPFWPALFLAMLATACLVAGWVFNGMVAGYLLAGFFVYVVVYTLWLKRRTWWNIVVGGLAGSFAVLAGAASVAPMPTPAVVALAWTLFLWTPSHFWSLAIARHEDYQRAGFPMLPVVKGNCIAARFILLNSLVLVTVSLTPLFHGMGWGYLLGAGPGGAWLLWANLRLVQTHSRKAAYRSFYASLGQLTLVLSGVLLDSHFGA